MTQVPHHDFTRAIDELDAYPRAMAASLLWRSDAHYKPRGGAQKCSPSPAQEKFMSAAQNLRTSPQQVQALFWTLLPKSSHG